MKKIITILSSIGVMLSYSATASSLSGLDIALKADQADNSTDSYRKAVMVIERGSKKLIRKMKMWDKKYSVNEERSLIRFDEPVDVRDTQYLSWVYQTIDKDDDLWIYFPTENIVRRISGGGKKGAFMRSDFANEDIEKRAVNDDTHILINSELFNGRDCYVIESTPIKEKIQGTNYSKRRIWVDKEYWLPVKTEHYDKRHRLLKTLIQGGIENIDGIFTPTKLIMETPKKKSRTLMQYFDIRYNLNLDNNLFEQSALQR